MVGWTTGEEDLVLDLDELFLEREPFLEPMPVSLLSDPLLENIGSDCTRGKAWRASAIVKSAQRCSTPLVKMT